MAEAMKCRPSQLLGVRDPLTAFYTDRATWTFAMTIQSDMDEAEKRLPNNAKDAAHVRARQKVLDQYMGIEAADQPGRFRTPG
jgi:hypothetical protein